MGAVRAREVRVARVARGRVVVDGASGGGAGVEGRGRSLINSNSSNHRVDRG